MNYLGEYWYNTIHHMSIKMSPFKALYGYEATTIGYLTIQGRNVQGAKDFSQQYIDSMNALKDNLHHAQNQQNMYADWKCVERLFEVGELVFLRLQPYKQSTLKRNGVEKLKLRFYGT